MATMEELLAQKLEIEYRIEEQKRKIRAAQANDAADSALPEDVTFFDAAAAQDVKELQAKAKKTAQTFMDRHPEFYACAENLGLLTQTMLKRKLAPTVVRNFEIAFELLTKAGALVEPPVTQELIDSLTADEFKDRLRDKTFAEAVERLNAR